MYSSALPKTNPHHPELIFCQENRIKTSKRDELLIKSSREKDLKLIAIAGTHGKTTTTAMTIWVLRLISIPASYSVGAKISFGDMGKFDPASEYFIYECDEFDRNFWPFIRICRSYLVFLMTTTKFTLPKTTIGKPSVTFEPVQASCFVARRRTQIKAQPKRSKVRYRILRRCRS